MVKDIDTHAINQAAYQFDLFDQNPSKGIGVGSVQRFRHVFQDRESKR
jgi:hypothetical protein